MYCAIAAAFWILLSGVGFFMNFVLRLSPTTASLRFLNRQGAAEVTLRVIMSMTSGFCEELVFRGATKTISGADWRGCLRDSGSGGPVRRRSLVPGNQDGDRDHGAGDSLRYPRTL